MAAGGENADGRWQTSQQAGHRRVYVIRPDRLGRSSLGRRYDRPMVARRPIRTVVVDGIARRGVHLRTTKEIGEMNGTMRRLLGRSVQLAVMAAPTTSVEHAVAEARRRHGSAVAIIRNAGRAMVAPQVPTTATA